jgi:hypothetical protein
LAKIPGEGEGQGFPDKIARGVFHLGFYCIFINKSFEICLGGPMFTQTPSPLIPLFASKLKTNCSKSICANCFFSYDIYGGSEVPMLVIFTPFMTGSNYEFFCSRCTSSLIVVCNKDAADKIVPESGCEFAYKIEVFGKFYLYLISISSQTCVNNHL